MSTHDPFAGCAAEFDRAVAPRPEFGIALGERLLSELRRSPASSGVGSEMRAPSWVWSLVTARPKTRLVLAVVVMLLLLGSVATATYLGVQSWIGESVRGAQARADYRLATVYNSPRSAWMDNYPAAAVSVDGRTVYLAHEGRTDGAHEILAISRPETGNTTETRQYLDLRAVADPGFLNGVAWGGLTASANGDLFAIGASAWREPLAMSVLVLRPDGSRQSVVTYRELRRAGLPAVLSAFPSDDGSFSIAASAPNRLWFRARVLRRPYSSGWPYDVTNMLFEVTDPNRDDDWSDKVIRRIALPSSVPGFNDHGRSSWWYGTLVPEPSLRGDDHSASVLLQATGLVGEAGSRRSVLTVIRVNDRNGDGDATDPGEVEPVVRAPATTVSQIASRVNLSGRKARREVVIAGLTRPDRVTAILSSGRRTDIGRSFPGWGSFDALLTDARGDILPIVRIDRGADGEQVRIYELEPTPTVRTPVTTVKPGRIPAPPGREQLLAVTMAEAGSPGIPGASYWIRPDGGEPAPIAPHAGGLCQSSDGSKLAFTSDLEVPRESFVYTAPIGKGTPSKASEQALAPACPFDGQNLVLASHATLPDGPTWSLLRHEVRSGQTAPLVVGTPRFAISPNGRVLAYVKRGTRGDSLFVLDLRTLSRHLVARTLNRTQIAPSTNYTFQETGTAGDDLQWSPDGSRLAFVTGKPFDLNGLSWSGQQVRPRRYTISTTQLEDGRVEAIATITGGPPSLHWSPDGTRLLACAATRGPGTGCGDHTTQGAYFPDDTESVLHLLDLNGGDRIVARGLLVYAGWRPQTSTYAWADDISLHLSTTSAATKAFSAGGAWLGWSPDGRYIALGPMDHYAVIDTKTGKRRTLIQASQDYMIKSVEWWHP